MGKIGIDFGSSFTTAAWTNPCTGSPEAIKFNGDGSVKMPSVILSTSGGLILGFQAQYYIEEVFKLAEEVKLEMLSNFIPSLKRILNPNSVEVIGDQTFSHKQLLSEFFKFLFGQIQEHCGEEFHIDGVCFSYPVEFEQAKIELIRDAILNLGYEVSNEQMEPIAAVIGFAQNHTIHDNECVLVFDFGGGTIDVACVQNRANGFRLVSKPSGSNTCGGQDIDMLIYNDIEKKIKSQTGLEITNHGMVDYSILNSCRRLKELFSGNNPLYEISVPLVVNGTFRTFRYSLNRESFNNIVYPKVTEAISIAKKVYSETVSKGYEVDKILLIGGSSKLTLISELLSSNFPNKPIETCGEKDIAVALGNLLSCADEQQIPEKSGKEEKVKDIPNLNKERSITCRQCGSKSCYKLQDEPGYYCLDCGWKGKNIIVHF